MAIGISLSVDAREVERARRETEALNQEFEKLNNAKPPDTGLHTDHYKEIVNRLREDVSRMGQLSKSVTSQGGFVNPKQMREIADVTSRVSSGFGKWREEIDKAREAVRSLLEEEKHLDREIRSGRGTQAHLDRLETIGGERREAQARISDAERHQARVEELQRRAERNNQVLGGAELQQPATTGFNLRKAFGYGAAILGVGTVMGFMSDALGKAGAMSAGRTDIGQRGGNYGFGQGVGLGFGPVAEVEIADALNKRSNWQGEELRQATLTAMQAARTFGVDESAMTGFVGGTRTATGMSASEYRQYLEVIRDIAKGKGGVGGRVEEYLTLNQQLLSRISAGAGGAAVGAEGASFLAELQGRLWAQGSAGQNGGIVGALNDAITTGGKNPGQQLFMWEALGGSNLAAGDLKGLWEYKQKIAMGAGDPENVRQVLAHSDKMFGNDPYMQRFQLEALGMKPAQVEALLGALGSVGNYSQVLNDPAAFRKAFASAKASGSLESDAAQGTDLNRHVQAQWEQMKVQVGDLLLPPINKFKDAILDSVALLQKGEIADAFLRAFKDNPIGQLMVGTLVVKGTMDGLSMGEGLLAGLGLGTAAGTTAAGGAAALGGGTLAAAAVIGAVAGKAFFDAYKSWKTGESNWFNDFFTGGVNTEGSLASYTSKGMSWLQAGAAQIGVDKKPHDEMAKWMVDNSTGAQSIDTLPEAYRYKAYLEHLQKEDPQALNGVPLIGKELIEALIHAIETHTGTLRSLQATPAYSRH